MLWIALCFLLVAILWAIIAAVKDKVKDKEEKRENEIFANAFDYFAKFQIYDLALNSCGHYEYDEKTGNFIVSATKNMISNFKDIVKIKLYKNSFNGSFDERLLSCCYKNYIYTTTFDNKYTIALCCDQSSDSLLSIQMALKTRDIYEREHPLIKQNRILEEIRDCIKENQTEINERIEQSNRIARAAALLYLMK